MELSEVVSKIRIDSRKLTDYALDPDNPVGRHKAYVFERVLGFTKEHYALLAEQLDHMALGGEAVLRHTDHHGDHYSVDLDVAGVLGQHGVIRTGWLVAPDSDEAVLTTLYVRKR